MKTKLLVLLMVLAMVMTAVACGGDDSTTGTTTPAPTGPTEPTTISVEVSVIVNGGEPEVETYEVDAGTTLKALFDSKIGEGETFENTLSYTEWTVNGTAATAETVLKTGDKVVATCTFDDPTPSNISVKVSVVVNGGEPEVDTYEVAEGTTLKALFETKIAGGEGDTFEETLSYTVWTVNGTAATATTVLKADDEVVATVTMQDPQPGTISVKVSIIVNDGEPEVKTYEVDAGTTLKALFETKIAGGEGETFEDTASYTVWTVNGTAATATTVLKNGDEVVATCTIKAPDQEYEGDYTLPY